MWHMVNPRELGAQNVSQGNVHTLLLFKDLCLVPFPLITLLNSDSCQRISVQRSAAI